MSEMQHIAASPVCAEDWRCNPNSAAYNRPIIMGLTHPYAVNLGCSVTLLRFFTIRFRMWATNNWS